VGSLAATGVPPACGRAGGLDVQGKQVTVHGMRAYAHVCVLGGGRPLVAAALTLRTGLLYVDAASSIGADGLPGGTPKTVDCARTGTGTPDGAPGHRLTILAQQAIVLGRPSASGGEGLSGTEMPCTKRNGGQGGNGGQIILEAARLTLQGRLVANGGPGGDGDTPDPLNDSPYKTGGNAGSGGDGGGIVVRRAQSSTARLAQHLQATWSSPVQSARSAASTRASQLARRPR
jgi:hypothetical protein